MSKSSMTDLLNPDAFDDVFRGFFRPVRWEGAPQELSIKVDVSETDDAYTVKAEIPGVEKENIDVSIDGNRLSLSAEVTRSKEDKDGGKVLRSERYYGQVSRTLTLDAEIDQDKASARYTNGVLELNLPKKPAAKTSKRLSIG